MRKYRCRNNTERKTLYRKQVQASHTIVRYEQENNIENKTNTDVENKTEDKTATRKQTINTKSTAMKR